MDEKQLKRKDAFFIFTKVFCPDHELRQYHDEKCFHELMEWKKEIRTYLDQRRNQKSIMDSLFFQLITLFFGVVTRLM